MAWIAETGTGASAQNFIGVPIVAGSDLPLKLKRRNGKMEQVRK